MVIREKEKELQADKKKVYSLMMIHSLLKCRQHICLTQHFQGVSYSYSFISFHCLYDIFYLLINARIKTKKNLAFGISFVYLSNIGKHSKMRNVFHSYFMLRAGEFKFPMALALRYQSDPGQTVPCHMFIPIFIYSVYC